MKHIYKIYTIHIEYTRKLKYTFFLFQMTLTSCIEVVGGVDKRGEREDLEEEAIFRHNIVAVVKIKHLSEYC